jgi:hypothetical protein
MRILNNPKQPALRRVQAAREVLHQVYGATGATDHRAQRHAARGQANREGSQAADVDRQSAYVSLTSPLKTMNTSVMSSIATHDVTNGAVQNASRGRTM